MYSEVKTGDFLLCEDEGNRFRRVRILRTAGGDEFDVFFIDYGTTAVVSIRALRRLPTAVAAFRQLAVRCLSVQDPLDCGRHMRDVLKVNTAVNFDKIARFIEIVRFQYE